MSFAADKEDDPFDEATWLKANPSLRDGGMPDLMKQYRSEAERAKTNPSLLSAFRALAFEFRHKPRHTEFFD